MKHIREKNYRRAAQFLLRFFLLAIPFYGLLRSGINFMPLQQVVAQQTGWILQLFGFNPLIDGNLIRIDFLILEVVEQCTAWRDLIAFVALVIAVPAVPLEKRLRAAIWLPVIYFVNLVRLATTAMIALVQPNLVNIVHSFLWVLGTLGIVLLFWFLWAKSEKIV